MRLNKNFHPGIKNIIFDLGGVIVDIEVAKSVEAFTKLNIKGLDVSDIHPHQRDFFLDYELGNITSRQFIAQIRNRYDCANISDGQIWDAWNAMLKGIDMRRFEFLDSIKRDYSVYLLSNTNEYHLEKVRGDFRKASSGRGFESYFDKCFYSHRMHMRKPDERIYRRVLEETGAIAKETLFIDDNDCNFPGAVAAGLNVYHLTGGETIMDIFNRP